MAPSRITLGILSTLSTLGGFLGYDYYRLRQERNCLLTQARTVAERPMQYDEELKRFKILYNPKESRDLFYDYVRDIFHAAYIEYELTEVSEPGQAYHQVQKWHKEDCDGIVAIGSSILKEVTMALVEKKPSFYDPLSFSASSSIPIGYIPLVNTHNFIESFLGFFQDADKMRTVGSAAIDIAMGYHQPLSLSQFHQLVHEDSTSTHDLPPSLFEQASLRIFSHPQDKDGSSLSVHESI